MIKRIVDSFYGRLALIAFGSFLLVGLLLLTLISESSRAQQNEITQSLHRHLAKQVVKENPISIDAGFDIDAVKMVFMKLMILGPNFEFYLLDAEGKILAYSADPGKVKRQSVDLNPIKAFLKDTEGERTTFGTDPRSEGKNKIFSATPIIEDGRVSGYLYVIIGGEIFDNITQRVEGSVIYQWVLWGLLAGLLLTLLITLSALALATGPLRRLARDVQHFQQQGFDKAENLQLNHWDPNSKNEISQLGYAFESMAEQLTQQYQKVKSLDDLRRELVSHVSHDLRTPLASLLGYLETWQIKQGDLDTKQSEELIQIAHKSAKKISKLVEQLFELAHLDSGDVQIHYESVPLAELVQDVLMKFSLEAKKKGVSLNVSPEDPTLVVMADIEKLDRVFTNLVGNAIRHCKKGDHITINLENETRRVLVQVKDSGIGIPASDLPYIFDAHFKAANSVRGNSAHGGLGLAITKKLLALHNSTISVSSIVDKGTEFDFCLETV